MSARYGFGRADIVPRLLKLGGRVDALVMPESEVQLAELARRLKENHLPFLPVGNLTEYPRATAGTAAP